MLYFSENHPWLSFPISASYLLFDPGLIRKIKSTALNLNWFIVKIKLIIFKMFLKITVAVTAPIDWSEPTKKIFTPPTGSIIWNGMILDPGPAFCLKVCRMKDESHLRVNHIWHLDTYFLLCPETLPRWTSFSGTFSRDFQKFIFWVWDRNWIKQLS